MHKKRCHCFGLFSASDWSPSLVVAAPRNLYEQLRLDAGVRPLGQRQIQHPAPRVVRHLSVVGMRFRNGQIAEVDNFHGEAISTYFFTQLASMKLCSGLG